MLTLAIVVTVLILLVYLKCSFTSLTQYFGVILFYLLYSTETTQPFVHLVLFYEQMQIFRDVAIARRFGGSKIERKEQCVYLEQK